jgi:hypothetical protein
MPSREYPSQPEDPRKVFVDKLELAREDPLQTALTIEEEMRVDLGTRLGFEAPLIEHPGTELSPDQIEKVNFLGSWTAFLCRRGILSPCQVGLWLEEPRHELGDISPLDSVFGQLNEGAEDSKVFDSMVEHCDSFVRPEPISW